MKSVVRRFGLWLTIAVMLLSSVATLLFNSDVLAVDAKSLSYKKTAEVSDCKIMQGGATDGTNAYFACQTSASSKTVTLVKTTLSGEEVLRKSFAGGVLAHANDMTYNAKTKQLIITRWDVGNKNKGELVTVDPETLKEIGRVDADTDSSWSTLCYNSNKDQYLSNGKLFDSNFKYTGSSVYSNDDVDNITGGGTSQGIACDESYVYVMRGGLGGGADAVSGKFKVVVYDWSGKNTAVYDVFADKYAEIENVFVANSSLYVGLNATGSSFKEQFGVVDGAVTGKGETGSANDGTRPVVIGSYNLHGTLIGEEGEDGCKAKTRFEVAAKNILSMGMDIVGMQEYSDYDDSKSPDCGGKQVKLLDMLNNGGGNWKSTKLPDGADGGGYQESQASILYNANVTKLMSDDAKNVTGGAIKDDAWPGVDCQGGSPIFHIAGFSDSSGNTFYVTNGHWCTVNEDQRNKDTEALMKIMSEYTGAKFVVGDTNSEVGQGVEKVMSSNKYGDAHLTAATKNAASYGTMAGNGKGNNIIDRIYYEEATVSSPSDYTNLNCKKSSTCGSDHRPISAVFPSIIVGSKNTECGGDQKQVFDLGVPYFNITPCVCAEASSGDSTLTGDSPAEQLFTFLVSTNISTNENKPLSAAQAAGAVGNIMRESGGDTYELKSDAVNSIGASGIVQWLGDREANLKTFAKNKRKEWTDLKTQLQFIIYEIEKSEKAIVKDSVFKSVGDDEAGAKTAAERWDTLYERSGGAGIENRQNNAVKAFNDFKDNAPGATTSIPASGNCGNDSVGDGDADALVAKVQEFAWADGRRSSSQKEAYTKALKGRYKGGNNGNDCGAFVSTLMVKSGFEPDYPGTNTTGQKTWLDKNWEKIASVGKVDVANLQPGDVAVISGSHVFVWIGDVDGFSGKSAEAALGSNTAPTAITKGNTFSLPSKYNWYRKKD